VWKIKCLTEILVCNHLDYCLPWQMRWWFASTSSKILWKQYVPIPRGKWKYLCDTRRTRIIWWPQHTKNCVVLLRSSFEKYIIIVVLQKVISMVFWEVYQLEKACFTNVINLDTINWMLTCWLCTQEVETEIVFWNVVMIISTSAYSGRQKFSFLLSQDSYTHVIGEIQRHLATENKPQWVWCFFSSI
jgi:hypothetical protein